MAENPEPAPSTQEPLVPPQALDEDDAVARDLTVPEVFVLIAALLLLVALGRAVERILSPFVLIGALLFILYPLRHNLLVSRLTVLGSIFFALWFFYSILGRLTPFIVAFLLAYLLNPMVTWLEKKGVPRWVSALTAILHGLHWAPDRRACQCCHDGCRPGLGGFSAAQDHRPGHRMRLELPGAGACSLFRSGVSSL